MAVESLDLKAIWNSGKTYAHWLEQDCQPRMREEMQKKYAEVSLSAEQSTYLKKIKRPVHVLALIEDWCGDVRHNAPALARVCAENPEMIRLRCVDKESRPQLMVRYLTNAAEAIPIYVFFNDAFVELGNWGPRPATCKKFMARGKAFGDKDAAYVKIKEFYANDKHATTVKEIIELIDIATATSV